MNQSSEYEMANAASSTFSSFANKCNRSLMLSLFRLCRGIFIYRKAFINQIIFDILNRLDIEKKVTKSKHHRLVTNIEKGYPFFRKKGKAFLHFLKITY